MPSLWGQKCDDRSTLSPQNAKHSPIDEPRLNRKNLNMCYKWSMRVWGTCARTEGGVLMYLSKRSEDHRPKTLMSQGGKLAEAAVVAAPMRKLWPANSLESSPPLESKSLVSLVNLPRVRKEPD